MELKFDITEEQIDEALRDAVSTMVNDAVEYRHGSMRGAVEHYLSEIIGRKVEAEVHGRFDEIAKEVADELMSKPVKLNDGWSTGKTYDTYAEFIGDKLRDRFSRDYIVRDAFKKSLEAKVDKVWDEYKKDAIAALLAKANALTKGE